MNRRGFMKSVAALGALAAAPLALAKPAREWVKSWMPGMAQSTFEGEFLEVMETHVHVVARGIVQQTVICASADRAVELSFTLFGQQPVSPGDRLSVVIGLPPSEEGKPSTGSECSLSALKDDGRQVAAMCEQFTLKRRPVPRSVQRVSVNFEGTRDDRELIRRFVEELNEASRDGGRIIVRDA